MEFILKWRKKREESSAVRDVYSRLTWEGGCRVTLVLVIYADPTFRAVSCGSLAVDRQCTLPPYAQFNTD
jgi:hypothetical protein